MIGDHVVLAAPAARLCDILAFGKQELGVGDLAVTLVAGNQPAVIGFRRVFHIVDDVADGCPYGPALAGVQRHDACRGDTFPSLQKKNGPQKQAASHLFCVIRKLCPVWRSANPELSPAAMPPLSAAPSD